jgi:general secretion pathway protein A
MSSGNPTLMTDGLKSTLCDHAAGNYRALTTMAANLLTVAAERNLTQLDEKLYFEVFSPETRKPRRAAARA